MKIGDLVTRNNWGYRPTGHRGRGMILRVVENPRYGECATVYWFSAGNISEYQTKFLKILSEST